MTLFRICIPLCALLTLLSSSATVVFASTPETLHSAAIETRVEQRRQERMKLRSMQLNPAEKQALSIFEKVQERAQARREQRQREAKEMIPADTVKMQVIDAINMERARMGVAPVTYNRLLEQAAQAHAQDMLTRDFFNHINPEGKTPTDRIKQQGYANINPQECRCSVSWSTGENIAKGQETVVWVMNDWMNSPPHREAILSKDYDEIGVGIAGDVWVTNFGSVKLEPVTGNRNQSSGIRMESEVDRLQ